MCTRTVWWTRCDNNRRLLLLARFHFHDKSLCVDVTSLSCLTQISSNQPPIIIIDENVANFVFWKNSLNRHFVGKKKEEIKTMNNSFNNRPE